MGHRVKLRSSSPLAVPLAALALTGCGGGGGGTGPRPAPISSAPVVTPPAPPPAPAGPANFPGPINGSTDARYSRSNASAAAGAISAYNAGATGKGVKIAVIDSGINASLPEFYNKVDPASQDVAANRGLVDNEGHGTAVSAVAAAGTYGRDILGVAYDSTILSLNTADPNDCEEDDGCKHSDGDIARALDIARLNGAKVVNISLGGEDASNVFLQAVRRASDAGMVIVLSAGNDSKADADGFGLEAARVGNGRVIVVGAHDANRGIASFSNKAGVGAPYYLAALGERVRAPDEKGDLYLWSGTSFSAPVVSGAAALLASAFPNLSGAQIVQLLLTTADDAGAAGRDAVFGNGIINIARAFSPQGRTTAAGSNTPVSLGNNGEASSAMGDAYGQSAGAIILDGYSRAYAVDLARTVYRAPQERPLATALGGDIRTGGASAGALAVSVTVDRNLQGQPHVGLAQTGLSYDDSRKARAIAGTALTRLTPATAIALGFAQSGRSLQQQLAKQGRNAFLVARDPMTRAGFHGDNASSMAIRHDLGPVALTVASERGKVYTADVRRTLGAPRYSISSVTADRSIGNARLSLGLSQMGEESTILGGRFSDAFGTGGATTRFADATLSYDLGSGFDAFASYRRGWTRVSGSGALVDGGRLSTDAFAFDLGRSNAFAAGDRLAFRIMQPLRVRSGGFDMTLPVSYSYENGSVGYSRSRFNLAPSGRELAFEAAYGLDVLGGAMDANLFLRTQPGHVAVMPNDPGAAIRFTLGF